MGEDVGMVGRGRDLRVKGFEHVTKKKKKMKMQRLPRVNTINTHAHVFVFNGNQMIEKIIGLGRTFKNKRFVSFALENRKV